MSSVTHMKTRSYKRSQHTTLPGQARPDLDFYLFFYFFICLFVCLFIIKLCHGVFGCKFASSMLNISVCGLNCRSLQISSEAGQT